MDLKKDAYGQEVFAYYQGKDSYEIVERDDDYISMSGGSPVYFAEYKDWPKIEKRAIKYVKAKVLDIGCGAGRVCLYLQKRGFKVIGIDNSTHAINVCKLSGIKEARLLPIENIDKLKRNNFDTIIMFGNNFGLFGNYKKAKILLKKFYRITGDDAIIIAETNDPYKTKNRVHLDYHRLNRKRRRMSGQLKIRIRFEKYISDWFDYLIVSKKEMRNILKRTGWRVKKFINSNGSSYIAIIEKVR